MACVAGGFVAVAFLQLGCGDDDRKATEPPAQSIEEFGVADSSGALVTVRNGGTTTGAIRMVVGEEALLLIAATVDGSPLPAGSKVVNVRIPSPDEVAFTLFPNSLSFVLYALRPASMEFVVTLDIPGIGLQESPPLPFSAVATPAIRGVLLTSQLGVRYQQLGIEESGRLLVGIEQASVVEVAFLDEVGEPIPNLGQYTEVRLALLDPVDGVLVEPNPAQLGGFLVSASLRIDPVWVVARVERGGLEIYMSNPIRVWIQGPPEQAGEWHGFRASNRPNGNISDLVSWDGLLVVSGAFESVGPLATHGVAAWDGIGWSPLGSGVTGVHGLINASGDLLAITSGGIQRWDSHEWVEFDPSESQDPAFFRHEAALHVQDNSGVWRSESEGSWVLVPWHTLAAQSGGTGSTVFAVRPIDRGQSIDYWDGEEWIRTRYWIFGTEGMPGAELRAASDRLFMILHESSDECRCGWSSVVEWIGSSWVDRLQSPINQDYKHLDLWRNGLLMATASQIVLLDGYERNIGRVHATHYSGIGCMAIHDDRLFVAGQFDRVDDTLAAGLAYYVLE